MSNFEHFADNVPHDIRQALLDLAEYASEELDGFNGCEGFGEALVSEIWGRDPGGFIPFQDGGFEASQLIRFDTDASYYVSDGMSRAANDAQQDALEAFLADEKLPADFDLWAPENDAKLEEYYEYEQEWFNDGALLRFEVWQDRPEGQGVWGNNATGNIFMRLSVNYSDGPYFRSKYDETLHELSLSPDVLLEAVKRWPDDWQARLWRQLTTKEEEKGGLTHAN
jgi:hypothetical protein